MNTYLVRLFSVCLCFGVLLLINSVIPLPTNTAEATTHTINLNYTNIYDNKTYLDIVLEARTYTRAARDLDFGISISNTCLTMHKNNVTTDCPTYEAILALFPDTSNQEVSGRFSYIDNTLQRGSPQLQDNYRWYDYQQGVILFIDPDAQTRNEIGMITIHSSLPFYRIADMSSKVEDNKRYLGTGRYVEDCRNAGIDGKNWIFLLGDTINYMRNDCDPAFTQFNSTIEYNKDLVVHDITTSNKWLHDQFLEWVKENCLFEYDKC